MYHHDTSHRHPHMSSEPEKKRPYSDSHLDSPEYRRRLMRKINTLIAVLEVANAKVRRSLQGPSADVPRLTRIQNNLSETLSVCRRAKEALERCEELPKNLPASLADVGDHVGAEELPTADVPGRPPGRMTELSSDQERAKFDRLGPIEKSEVRGCDLDDLCRRLLA